MQAIACVDVLITDIYFSQEPNLLALLRDREGLKLADHENLFYGPL